MNRFLPREKMGKREKRALDKAKRTTWDGINPITRKTENKKAYNRKKSPRWYNDDSTGIFVCQTVSKAINRSLLRSLRHDGGNPLRGPVVQRADGGHGHHQKRDEHHQDA